MYTLSLISYYLIAGVIVFLSFYRKLMTHRFLYGIVTTIGIIFIASELWELPIFIMGFLGIAYWYPYPSLIFVLGHVNIVFMSSLIAFLHRPQAKAILPLLGLNFIIGIFLTLPFPSLHNLLVFFGWIARSTTLLSLTVGFYYGSSLVRV